MTDRANPTTQNSICEVLVNGVVMASATMDAETVHLALSLGINPLPQALHKIANELEARDAS